MVVFGIFRLACCDIMVYNHKLAWRSCSRQGVGCLGHAAVITEALYHSGAISTRFVSALEEDTRHCLRWARRMLGGRCRRQGCRDEKGDRV